jgi:hypothetical protein
MSASRFFAFSNQETRLFFEWLTTDNPGFDATKEIDKALASMDPEDVDDTYSMREAVAARVDEFFNCEAAAECEGTDPDGDEDSLRNALLDHAFREVNVSDVAEGLLRLHGKWPANEPAIPSAK